MVAVRCLLQSIVVLMFAGSNGFVLVDHSSAFSSSSSYNGYPDRHWPSLSSSESDKIRTTTLASTSTSFSETSSTTTTSANSVSGSHVIGYSNGVSMTSLESTANGEQVDTSSRRTTYTTLYTTGSFLHNLLSTSTSDTPESWPSVSSYGQQSDTSDASVSLQRSTTDDFLDALSKDDLQSTTGDYSTTYDVLETTRLMSHTDYTTHPTTTLARETKLSGLETTEYSENLITTLIDGIQSTSDTIKTTGDYFTTDDGLKTTPLTIATDYTTNPTTLLTRGITKAADSEYLETTPVDGISSTTNGKTTVITRITTSPIMLSLESDRYTARSTTLNDDWTTKTTAFDKTTGEYTDMGTTTAYVDATSIESPFTTTEVSPASSDPLISIPASSTQTLIREDNGNSISKEENDVVDKQKSGKRKSLIDRVLHHIVSGKNYVSAADHKKLIKMAKHGKFKTTAEGRKWMKSLLRPKRQ